MASSDNEFASGSYVYGGNTGTHGIDYESYLAFGLFVRASLDNSIFKIATELKSAGKFDDSVIFFNKPKKEVWLFQAKHDQSLGTPKLEEEKEGGKKEAKVAGRVTPTEILFNDLFPNVYKGKCNFALYIYMNSYMDVLKEKEFEEYEKQFFIFTNKSLGDIGRLKEYVDIEIYKNEEVNKIIRFAKSDELHCYVKFKPRTDKINKLLDFMNLELIAIKDAIIELFKTGKVLDILIKYRKFVQSMLVLSKQNLKLSEDFLYDKLGDTHKLIHEKLKEYFNNVDIGEEYMFNGIAMIAEEQFKAKEEEGDKNSSVYKKKQDQALKGIQGLMKGDSRKGTSELPKWFDEKDVIDFFQHLTFCVNQPNNLKEAVEEDFRLWMRSWIPPDVFGKLDNEQLRLPMYTFNRKFEEFCKSAKETNEQVNYLSFNEGQMCVKKMQKLPSFNRSDTRKVVYINRDLVINNNIKSDQAFIEQLISEEGENNFYVFIGEPGMGKTTLLQYIAFEIQKNSNHDVLLIYLNSLHEQLETMSDCKDLETVYNILDTVLSKASLQTLKNNLEKDENHVTILFDGFDEIEYPDKAIAMTKQLLSRKNVQVIISGRYHVQDKLENTFDVRAINLVPFKNDEQMQLLKNYWRADDSEAFVIYSTQLLGKFYSDMPDYQYNFFGLPLMIRMLAEVYADDFKEYSSSDPETRQQQIFSQEKFNVILLYERFVEFSFEIKLKKVNNVDSYQRIHKSKTAEMKRLLYPTFTIEHQIAAIEQLRNDKLKQIITLKDKEIYEDLMTKINDGTEKSPLFNVSNGEIKFVHLSYAEFFVAKFVYDRIKDFDANLFVTLRYEKTVRRFLFMLIEENFSDSSIQIDVLDKMCTEQPVVAFWACEASCVEIVTKLLTHDLKTRVHKEYGTLLNVATSAGCKKMVSFLLDSGLDGNSACCEPGNFSLIPQQIKNIKRPLHIASEKGYLEIAQLLLDQSAAVDSQDEGNETPLHYASANGHLAIAQLLLDQGANVNARDESNETPLHYASKTGHLEIAQLLHNGSAIVDAQAKWNETPLQYACENGHLAIVQLLLDQGANVNARDAMNETPLHYASKEGHLEIAQLLHDRSPKVDLQ